MTSWKNLFRAGLAMLALGITACGQGTDPGTAEDQAVSGHLTTQAAVQAAPAPSLDANGQPPPDYRPTPYGFRHKSCVYEVPNGATVDAQGNVTVNGATTAYAPCAYAMIPNPHGQTSPEDGGAPPTIGHAWVESDIQTTGGVGFNQLFEVITAPSLPSSSLSQVIYFFPALQSSSGQSSLPLMQPVLAWGNNGINCGQANYWCLASWYLLSGNTYYTSSAVVWPGDNVWMNMYVASNYCCGQNWVISGWDSNNGDSSSLTVQSTTWFKTASPAVMEVYNLDYCDQYPSNGYTQFADIELDVPNPGWTQFLNVPFNPTAINASGSLSPQCGYFVDDVPQNDACFLGY